NYSLAHGRPATQYIDPGTLAEIALLSTRDGSVGMAFTYNEPGIWYEYIQQAAIILKEKGLKVVLVTNGYMEEKPLKALLPFVDALNIDVKAFTNEFYIRNCKGKLDPVKASVELAKEKCHVEITTLVIPGENDKIEEISSLACWLKSLDPNIPLHLSRYHPAYQFKHPATPPEILSQARDAAREYLHFVFIGNLMEEENQTHCLKCGGVLIKRNVYQVQITGWDEGRCRHCGTAVNYIVC
ncbi:MAG: radical SAM protein, partial [Syntrophomonas sp.]